MQGTVWGSLLCNSVDMLGKISYSTPQTLYLYKEVPIPHLGMVDEIIYVTNVKNALKIVNNLINTFIESKNLTLSLSNLYIK